MWTDLPGSARLTPRALTHAGAVLLVGAFAGCSSTPSAGPGVPGEELVPAPWQLGRLPAAAVPQAYLTAWSRAENRSRCALIAVADAGIPEPAVARTATFSGGWAVAYDQPGLRSAFGVAGTGVAAADATYDAWPHARSWADGSTAGYGPEGGTGPNQLAYLRISGQSCLYNVWSRLGRAHLEQLLDALRFVETGT